MVGLPRGPVPITPCPLRPILCVPPSAHLYMKDTLTFLAPNLPTDSYIWRSDIGQRHHEGHLLLTHPNQIASFALLFLPSSHLNEWQFHPLVAYFSKFCWLYLPNMSRSSLPVTSSTIVAKVIVIYHLDCSWKPPTWSPASTPEPKECSWQKSQNDPISISDWVLSLILSCSSIRINLMALQWSGGPLNLVSGHFPLFT